MHITHLKLSNFRNLRAFQTEVPEGARIIALVGPNGSGKTSVLEALSLLGPGRGLLTAEGKAQVRHGGKEWGIWAQLGSGAELGQLYRSERVLHVDGHRAPVESLARHGSVVALTPATDFMFSGPPAARRRWLDDLATALDPAHAEAVARFRQHRQARLKLLTNGERGDWLDAEEKLAAEWGIRVLVGRQAYLASLQAYLEGLALRLTGNALEVMADANPAAALKGKFERSRDVDARMGRTHAGPNTLDLAGELTLEDARQVPLAQASSGQHKRALVLWLVAHVQLLKNARNQSPLVLIDEFSAHLDTPRRRLLVEALTGAGCQIWLSDIETPPAHTGLHVIPLGPETI